jgi:dTDP-4-amino-4,6-dideoxygalactose transaminase
VPILSQNTRYDDSVWLRFPVEHPRAAEIIRAARREGIYLGDWYKEVIAPTGTDLAKMRYQQGSCPVAEEAAKRVLNLPTHPRCSLYEAKKVVDCLLRFSE